MNTPAQPARIEIVVSPTGAVRIKTAGFTGPACRDATRDLERALGITARESLLPEFHAPVESTTRLRQGS